MDKLSELISKKISQTESEGVREKNERQRYGERGSEREEGRERK